MSGLGIPTYVVDSPHGGGKIPVMPNYLISAGDDAVVLRNFEGQIVRYQAQDKPITSEPTITRGVSSLLQGTRSVIVPEGSERMARRALRVLDDESPSGGCNGGRRHPELDDEPAADSPTRVRRRKRARVR
jgi:lysine 2,3-aminomutase